MEVFIGSSSQGKDDLAVVERLIRDEEMKALAWLKPGTFKLNSSTWESLLQLTKRVDAGAFIFREDDHMLTQGTSRGIARDNVILEFGLFCGALGAEKCAVFLKGDPWIPADLKGVTIVSLDNIKVAQEQVRAWGIDMKSKIRQEPDLCLPQIRAVGKAMLENGITTDRMYFLLLKLGASAAVVNHAFADVAAGSKLG
jgi:predicted nucleotide-binding protein